MPLISIVVDIAYGNPRTYPVCTAILSKLISFLSEIEQKKVIKKTMKKFSQIPNTGYMQLWLQRILVRSPEKIDFTEPLCKLMTTSNTAIWNNDWISSKELKKAVSQRKIINKNKLKALSPIIQSKEIALFVKKAEQVS